MNTEKRKHIALLAVGVCIIFASLWGGTLLLHWLGVDHWAMYPTLVTSMIFFFCGVLLVAYSIRELDYLGGF